VANTPYPLPYCRNEALTKNRPNIPKKHTTMPRHELGLRALALPIDLPPVPIRA
jgi:hypothetical protein